MRGSVRLIIGVYAAHGSLLGELAYIMGRLLGRTRCALCDITHAALGEKPAFTRLRDRFPVGFETLHLDEQPAPLAAFTSGRTPCVVAETDDGFEMLATEAELSQCAGQPPCLEALVESRLAGR